MDFSQTYLYKLRKLTSNLDKIFDQTLRTHSSVTLSQFTFLLTVNTFSQTNQQKVASFLGISTPAVSRQADIAYENGWIKRTTSLSDRHGYTTELTTSGKKVVSHGVIVLEAHVFKIFAEASRQTDLMGHIDMLLNNIKGITEEQAVVWQRENLIERN